MIKQVFIVSQHLMFSYGLESLIEQTTNMKVVGRETNIGQAMAQIEAVEPDIVILESDRRLAKGRATTMQILEEQPGTVVINMSLNHNYMCAYRSTCWKVKQVDDLMYALDEVSHPLSEKERVAASH